MSRWDEVLAAIDDIVRADDRLATIYGASMRLAGDAGHTTPSLHWRIITNTIFEQWEPVLIQFEQWTDEMDELIVSEAALLDLFNPDIPMVFAGVYMWAEFVEGADLSGPDRPNVFGRGVRFRFQPLRSEYVSN